MAKIEIKKPVVEEISASIKDAQSVVLVDYRGLTVEQDTKLRKELREAGISTTDATAPARILAKFAKTADKLEIKAGIVEGTFYDAKGIDVIASIPSREELLSKFLGSIQSPITNFARCMNQLAEKGGAGECAAPAAKEAVAEAPAAEEAVAEAPAEA